LPWQPAAHKQTARDQQIEEYGFHPLLNSQQLPMLLCHGSLQHKQPQITTQQVN
jgi:hypothetical protein